MKWKMWFRYKVDCGDSWQFVYMKKEEPQEEVSEFWGADAYYDGVHLCPDGLTPEGYYVFKDEYKLNALGEDVYGYWSGEECAW